MASVAKQYTFGLVVNQYTSGLVAKQYTFALVTKQHTFGLVTKQYTFGLVVNQYTFGFGSKTIHFWLFAVARGPAGQAAWLACLASSPATLQAPAVQKEQ